MIEQRLRFLEIDQRVIDELRHAKQVLEPELDRMLAQFYSHIANEPQLKHVFADDNSMQRARAAQKDHWLNTLFGGKFNSDYFGKAEQIGRAHERVGLTPNWYIGGYSKMLVQFIQQISAAAANEGRDASATIEALCKAVFLDLDLVIHCYLEAKDQAMLEILQRATKFTHDLNRLNSELGVATGRIKESTKTISKEVRDDHRIAGQLGGLFAQIDALADKAKQIDERLNKLMSGDRLFAQTDLDRTGTFVKLKALLFGR